MKRKGIVRISKTLIENQHPDLNLLFAKFIPVYIDNNYFDFQLVYHGYSDLFDELKDGEKPPEYEAIAKNGIEIEFKRIK